MSLSQSRFYVTGGTLRPDTPSYIERQADTDLYEGLSRGEFCYILTSRQMGKSSLMARTAARLRAEGVQVAVLDLTAIGQNLTIEQWYDGLLTQLGRHLDLEDEVEDYWLDHERRNPLQRWMGALRDGLLRSPADLASLLDLYGKVRAGKRVDPNDTDPLLDLLRLSGVVRLNGNRLSVRNHIYERVFDQGWVRQHMPDAEVRRQREAYRRGVVRTISGSAVVLAVVAGLAGAAVREATRARAATQLAGRRADEASDNLYAANMNLIQSDWEHGNVGRIRALLEETRGSRARGFEWDYWNRLCHLDLLTLTGHTGWVWSARFSPDGRRIVTGSYDQTAKVWDALSGRELLTLKGHTRPVWSARFSPDGRRIVTGSLDQTAKVWDTARGWEMRTLKGHTGAPTAAGFSAGSRRMLTGSGGGTAKNRGVPWASRPSHSAVWRRICGRH